MAGVINTTHTFADAELITSGKLNNLIDETTFTTDAYDGTTITVGSGKLKVAMGGITANEIAVDAVTTVKILDGQVTAAKLAAGAAIPSGAVMPFAMNLLPDGWLACNGAPVNRTTYAALFLAISTTYGVGDGSSTFNLPDLRGYFVRGLDNSRGIDTARALGSNQADAFKAHTHTLTMRDDSGGNVGTNVEGGNTNVDTAGTATTASTGDTETRPKNVAMFYCIKI